MTQPSSLHCSCSAGAVVVIVPILMTNCRLLQGSANSGVVAVQRAPFMLNVKSRNSLVGFAACIGNTLRTNERVNEGVVHPTVCTYLIFLPMTGSIGLLNVPAAVILGNWYTLNQFVPPSSLSWIVISKVGVVPVTEVTGITT